MSILNVYILLIITLNIYPTHSITAVVLWAMSTMSHTEISGILLNICLVTEWQGFHIWKLHISDGHLPVHLFLAMKSLLKALAVVFPSQKYLFRVEHPLVVYNRACPVRPMFLWISGPSYVPINRLLFLKWGFWNCYVHCCDYMVCLVWLPTFSWFVLSINFFFIFCFCQMHALLSCLLSVPGLMD